MELARGFHVGPYEILERLGDGGMGTVYRARDPRLGRDVAIKVLRPEVMADPDRRHRFQQEAQAVSALSHPNIVTVHDIGSEGDIAYMVMELVDGRSLIPTGGMRVSEVLRIGAQIADACARAHASQIVHRDLKPANVMLQHDGRIKVLDFGLAKLVQSPSHDDGRTLATRTTAGTISGTVAYMSPEQAEGKPLDQRSDIFSLGVVLYELCSGVRPFRGDSQASVLAEVLRQDPTPLGELRADVPAELARLVTRCLRKDPARRVQSMADLKVALEELREEADSGRLSAPLPAAVGARRAPRRAVLAVIGAAVAVAAVATFAPWRQFAGDRTPAEASLQPVPLTSYPGLESPGSFSPDGNQVVFSWDGEARDNFDIYVKLLGPGPPLRLTTDPLPDGGPRWSPDGRHIAFLRRIERDVVAVTLVPPLGGPERRLALLRTRLVLGAVLTTVCWTPDSRHLFVSGSRSPGEPNQLHRVSIDTGDIETLRTVDAVAEGYAGLDVSPDGRRLAAVRLDSTGSRRLELNTLSSDYRPQEASVLESAGTNVGAARWTADSRDLVFSISVNNPLPLYRVHADGGKPTAMAWVGPGAYSPIVAATGGRLVFGRDSRDTNIWRVRLDESGTRSLGVDQLASSSFREVFPQYSPDGQRLAFFSNRGGSVQIWTSAADGSRAVQLTSLDPKATTGSPRWSPDGQRIAFDSNANGGYQIYLINADGGQPRALTSGPTSNFIPAWSPDGRWIYFSSNRGGRLEVWRMTADGSSPEQITHGGGAAPTVSSDGQWV